MRLTELCIAVKCYFLALMPRGHLLLPTAVEVGKSAAGRSRRLPFYLWLLCITRINPVAAICPSRNRGKRTASGRPTLSFMNPRFICGRGFVNDRAAAPVELTSMFYPLRRLSDGRLHLLCVYALDWRKDRDNCLLEAIVYVFVYWWFDKIVVEDNCLCIDMTANTLYLRINIKLP